MILEDAFSFSGQKIQYFQAFSLRDITQCVQRGTPHFLAAIKIKHIDGLSVTALCGSINQCYRFKTTSGIPLPTFTCRKHLNPFKNGLLVFAFYIVGLEGKPANLAIHLIKAWMFFNTVASPR